MDNLMDNLYGYSFRIPRLYRFVEPVDKCGSLDDTPIPFYPKTKNMLQELEKHYDFISTLKGD